MDISFLLCTPSRVLSKGALDPVRQFTPVTEELPSLSENRNRQVPEVSLGPMRTQKETRKCVAVGKGHVEAIMLNLTVG